MIYVSQIYVSQIKAIMGSPLDGGPQRTDIWAEQDGIDQRERPINVRRVVADDPEREAISKPQFRRKQVAPSACFLRNRRLRRQSIRSRVTV
jgi:hypothetical protein